jgi:hypothetical protein
MLPPLRRRRDSLFELRVDGDEGFGSLRGLQTRILARGVYNVFRELVGDSDSGSSGDIKWLGATT